MANLYAQLDDLKSLLRIPASDTVDDAQLTRSIEAASRRIDGVCDRVFYQELTATARVYDATNLASVSIDDVSTLTGFVVKVDDGFDYATTLVLDVDFRVEPLNNLSKGLPVYRLVSLSGIFPRSTVRLGVAGFTDMGVITVRGVDPDVDHLIQPFRRMAVG
jgi:hypothetical protein